jgi:hypothetical protein
MTVARLTAGLLARKGTAFPIANAYANPLLDPLPVRRDGPARTRPVTGAAARCRLSPELYTRLRILAARQGRPLRAVLETAVGDFLAANGENCPCMGAGARTPTKQEGCCQGQL